MYWSCRTLSQDLLDTFKNKETGSVAGCNASCAASLWCVGGCKWIWPTHCTAGLPDAHVLEYFHLIHAPQGDQQAQQRQGPPYRGPTAQAPGTKNFAPRARCVVRTTGGNFFVAWSDAHKFPDKRIALEVFIPCRQRQC
jgi:hypothetical protein